MVLISLIFQNYEKEIFELIVIEIMIIILGKETEISVY
ncbi:MAG: hypothetical protein BAJALOKI3v1_60070 [Promethearchaeota archaeon]|nr:MAG: hypothetical protein BAJALOKI3v1_60070 [Candidatus Lokiarchaeota archaeon]